MNRIGDAIPVTQRGAPAQSGGKTDFGRNLGVSSSFPATFWMPQSVYH
jgi:hypothetical protein